MERRMKSDERIEDVLDTRQQAVTAQVVQEEQAHREHLVISLCGAHAYGFPSPDSDLDLKAIHIAPTARLLGLDPPVATIDRGGFLDGVEIDYTSNELGHALAGILAGHGNFIERVLGRLVLCSSPLLAALRPIVAGSLSRRIYRHYHGFAQNQLQLLLKAPTVKKLLYVLRTAVTGIHALSTGEVEPDLTRIMDRYDLADAATLVAQKRAGEHTVLDPMLLDAWRPRIDTLFARLVEAQRESPLPEAPANQSEVEAWLLAVRRSKLA